MKEKLISQKLQEIKSCEESICFAYRAGQNTSPLYFERGRLIKELASIR